MGALQDASSGLGTTELIALVQPEGSCHLQRLGPEGSLQGPPPWGLLLLEHSYHPLVGAGKPHNMQCAQHKSISPLPKTSFWIKTKQKQKHKGILFAYLPFSPHCAPLQTSS